MRIDRNLFYEIIDDIETYIPKLITASGSVGDLFYEPINDESVQVMSQYINGLSGLVQAVMMTIKDAEEHAPAIIELLTNALVAVTHKLNAFEQAFQSQDYTQVADILKFEVSEHLVVLLNVIRESKLS